MKTDTFEQLTADQLIRPYGGIPAAAQWIMMHESGGSTTAGHLHAQGRGDGTPGNQSSAFGAFQMIEAQRKHYMGADYQSTSFAKQYAAASHYVSDHVGATDLGAAALTHGFQIAFYVLAGVALAGAVLSALIIESNPAQAVSETVEQGERAPGVALVDSV